jgi:hypothetical protein
MRSRQSLRGNHCLAEDSIAKLRLEGRRRHEIDAVPNDFRKLALQADELEETHGAVELDEQIHIAIVAAFVTSE